MARSHCIGAFTSLLAFALGAASPQRSIAADYVAFRTPSGGIGCAYTLSVLRCDVLGGIKPLPPAPKDCDFDWGQGYWLHRTGTAHIVCAGDTALVGTTVVPYGTTWRHAGFACSSARSGLRCSNRDGHVLFLSKVHSYRF